MPLSLTADALRLRAWALPVLAGAASAPVPNVAPAAWDLFLRGEQCAIALRAAVAAAGVQARPGAGALGVLEARATRELQRALAARGLIRKLGAALAERGWPGIVLKGGVPLAGGGALVDVADVDLLVPRAHAAEAAALLDARGFHATAVDPWEHSTEAFHLAPRAGGHGVLVELHVRLPYVPEVDPWRDPRPGGTPGILRLPPADHAWHVLVHGVDHHVERRGRLRDLLLLGAALAECGAGDHHVLEERMAAHGSAAALRATVTMARALAARAAPDDPFRETAALRCLLAAGAAPFALDTARGLEALGVAAALVSGEYGRKWYGDHGSALTRPQARGSHWMDRRLPLLAWPGRAVWRGTRLLVVTLPAARLARAARRAAADAARAPAPSAPPPPAA